MKTGYLPMLVRIALVLALAGCGPSAAQMTATAQSAVQMTLTAAPTITPSASPTPTETQTPTATVTLPSPTATALPTVAASPTPDRAIVGIYSVSGCSSTSMSKGGTLDFCVTGVTVDRNQHLIFSVTWNSSNIPDGYTVTKRSDEGNRKMYLIDNTGKRYDHIAGGDAAYQSVVIGSGVPVSGWFDFGPAGLGAFSFDFHDDDNEIVIGGLSLLPGSGTPIISYEDFTLEQYPLLLQYRTDLWAIAPADGGGSKFVDKAIPACTVQAQDAQQPKGDFKNQVADGLITYDIYGYLLDQATNLYMREYIYVSGLQGVDAKHKPFFTVTIPGDSSTDCIFAASNLLSSLAPKKP